MKDFDYTQLSNNLLDFTIEAFGLVETCKILVGLEYTDEQLYYLGFEQDTITEAKK
jgi:hypothetical protein